MTGGTFNCWCESLQATFSSITVIGNIQDGVAPSVGPFNVEKAESPGDL